MGQSTLHDVGHEVMELLEGETLADRLTKGPLPPEQVLKYGIEICEGLEKAHRSGVVHRDLKPGNIMLTKTGAKLLDFGLAKATPVVTSPPAELTATIASPSGGHPLTAQGMVVGTYVDDQDNHHAIPLSAVDRQSTRKLNRERKLDLWLPAA